MKHLVAAVHFNSVVTRGAHKVAMPLFRPVIEIAASVNQNVVTSPPDVKMQHVDLRKAIQQTSAAEGTKAVALSPS